MYYNGITVAGISRAFEYSSTSEGNNSGRIFVIGVTLKNALIVTVESLHRSVPWCASFKTVVTNIYSDRRNPSKRTDKLSNSQNYVTVCYRMNNKESNYLWSNIIHPTTRRRRRIQPAKCHAFNQFVCCSNLIPRGRKNVESIIRYSDSSAGKCERNLSNNWKNNSFEFRNVERRSSTAKVRRVLFNA